MQLWKASSSTDVTVVGITVFLQPKSKVLLSVSMMALQLFRESYFGLPLSTDIVVNLPQPLNATSPMAVTLAGMVSDVSPEQ